MDEKERLAQAFRDLLSSIYQSNGRDYEGEYEEEILEIVEAISYIARVEVAKEGNND